MSDVDCTPGREPRSVAASIMIVVLHVDNGEMRYVCCVFRQREHSDALTGVQRPDFADSLQELEQVLLQFSTDASWKLNKNALHGLTAVIWILLSFVDVSHVLCHSVLSLAGLLIQFG